MMDDILQQKVSFLEDFYGIKGLMNEYYEPPNVYLEAFLDNGSLVVFFDELLQFLSAQSPKMQSYSVELFIESLVEGHLDVWIDTIDALFKNIETAKANESTPDIATKRAIFVLSMHWWKFEDDIHDISPVTHLKFQISLLYCMHIKTPITNLVALPESSKQLYILESLIRQNPELANQRNKLERESGIDRATIRRLLKK